MVPQYKLVIFDAFNTLVRPVPGAEQTFAARLARAGLASSPAALAQLQRASQGLDHRQWSQHRASYCEWTARTLELLRPDSLHALAQAVIPALEQWHQAPMTAFPDATPCLSELTAAGIAVAVCSNWGWDLRNHLAGAGLGGLAQVTVSSASAGCRKPHPQIYQRVLDQAGVPAGQAIFVGDSYETDVLGPRRAGISAVLLDRLGRGGTGGLVVQSLADVVPLVTG